MPPGLEVITIVVSRVLSSAARMMRLLIAQDPRHGQIIGM
jgi:hypothetical protein